MQTREYDLAIVGGGVNGCGIARDAAGRGLSVVLCEQGDLASGTSSASTKLIHGGLRYLEYYEFRLVREALKEREVLLRAAPHIIWPLRFILPHHKGLRPGWLIRLGLFLYDHLGNRELLPGTTSINLQTDVAGKPLKQNYRRGFEYSDCWVMDGRLVALNAMDAAAHGADIRVCTRCTAATRANKIWTLQLHDQTTGAESEVRARVLVNATGPWLDSFLSSTSHTDTGESVRKVKGSHIIINKLFEHGRAYLFQNPDGRIIFAIPYEHDFTLIGTTDVDYSGDPGKVHIDEQEKEYLCSAASEYFQQQVTLDDIVHAYSGIRPLFDDGASDAKAATRDYILKLDDGNGEKAPLLSIYGGKITTYRKLAEAALARLEEFFPASARTAWTESATLPGGDFSPGRFSSEVDRFQEKFSFLDNTTAFRLIRTYGTRAYEMLDGCSELAQLGICFGSCLYEKEVRYLMENEWARTAEDVLWRRTNMGLFFTEQEKEDLAGWMDEQMQEK
jgi:glycerol-3-phosphate dehydrogenase